MDNMDNMDSIATNTDCLPDCCASAPRVLAGWYTQACPDVAASAMGAWARHTQPIGPALAAGLYGSNTASLGDGAHTNDAGLALGPGACADDAGLALARRIGFAGMTLHLALHHMRPVVLPLGGEYP